jgi:hypothetical protein
MWRETYFAILLETLRPLTTTSHIVTLGIDSRLKGLWVLRPYFLHRLFTDVLMLWSIVAVVTLATRAELFCGKAITVELEAS